LVTRATADMVDDIIASNYAADSGTTMVSIVLAARF